MPKRTPLYEQHKNLGARLVDFAGWEMPVQYSGVIDEHLAVRSAAGLFDVSHMGEVEIRGPGALAFVHYLTPNDASLLTDGKAQYSLLCNERGGVVDDIIVYRHSNEHLLIVVNASNREKDLQWIKSHAPADVVIDDRSDDFALLALQGPASFTILSKLCTISLESIPPFGFREVSIAGRHGCVIARTGYTGEPGVEIFCPPGDASAIWTALLETGHPLGLKPAGLGARDTLRLEMAYSLYGQELTDETNPLEAGLSWVVKLKKSDDFIGKRALQEIAERGLTKKLTGFQLIERGIPRSHYAISDGKKVIGEVTSGTMSPSLQQPIGLGYVPVDVAAPGKKFSIDIRGSLREAVAVTTPFYHPQKQEWKSR